MRPFFVKDNQAVFLYFRGQMDYQRRLIKYETKSKAIEVWLAITMQRPVEDNGDVVAEASRLRQAERERQQTEVCQAFAGPPGGLQGVIDGFALPDATVIQRGKQQERPSGGDIVEGEQVYSQTKKLAALMALVMADLSELQRETLMNLIF